MTLPRSPRVLPLLLLAGCFTLKQTEQPSFSLARAPEGRDVKVAVAGFAATVTDYVPVFGTQTVYVDRGPYVGRRGGRIWGGGRYETVTSETLVPQTRASDAYLRRAQTRLEDAGFLVRAPQPDYTVEVAFEGPFVRDDERAVACAWMFLSVLSAEYATQTWTATLRVYDAKTGRVLFAREGEQKYEHCVWSPLFFVGLSGCTENTFNFMQNWCLAALTDRMVAEAAAFLATAARPAATAKPTPVRVLAIGNSYTQSLLPEFPKVAQAAGCALDLAVFAVGGMSLSNHWANCEAALKDASVRPYVVNGRKTNLPEILSEKAWDVVTLQEQSADGMYPEKFNPWADRLVAFVRRRLPKARICFQQTWSDTAASPRVTDGGAKGTLGMTQDEMYAALEANYAFQARRLGAAVIPVGTAVQIYRKELPVRLVKPTAAALAALKDGELPDLKGELSGWWEWSRGRSWEADYGTYRLRQDFHHLNAEGRYLQACVWTAALFGVDVSALPYAPDLGADFARRAPFIRACAMKAVHGRAVVAEAGRAQGE